MTRLRCVSCCSHVGGHFEWRIIPRRGLASCKSEAIGTLAFGCHPLRADNNLKPGELRGTPPPVSGTHRVAEDLSEHQLSIIASFKPLPQWSVTPSPSYANSYHIPDILPVSARRTTPHTPSASLTLPRTHHLSSPRNRKPRRTVSPADETGTASCPRSRLLWRNL